MEFCVSFPIEIEYGNHCSIRNKWHEDSHVYTHFVRFKDAKQVGFPIGWIVSHVQFYANEALKDYTNDTIFTSWVGRKDKLRSPNSRDDEITFSFEGKRFTRFQVKVVFFAGLHRPPLTMTYNSNFTAREVVHTETFGCMQRRQSR